MPVPQYREKLPGGRTHLIMDLTPTGSLDNTGVFHVPPGHIFAMGDNRDNSLDSRYWGFVPDSMVKGRPIMVYFSYAPDSADALAIVTHVRWRRLGTRIH